MSSPTPSRDDLLAASQRRAESHLSEEQVEEIRFDQERDTRQAFRRLLDPGILRGVEKKTALASIKVNFEAIDQWFMSRPCPCRPFSRYLRTS